MGFVQDTSQIIRWYPKGRGNDGIKMRNRPWKPFICYRCREEGHKAYDCKDIKEAL